MIISYKEKILLRQIQGKQFIILKYALKHCTQEYFHLFQHIVMSLLKM